jgi:hypothetical protein
MHRCRRSECAIRGEMEIRNSKGGDEKGPGKQMDRFTEKHSTPFLEAFEDEQRRICSQGEIDR